MNRNTAYNEAFARVAVQLGLVTEQEIRELGPDSRSPEWDRLVGKAGLDKMQINMIEAELVRLVEVCSKCRTMRYRRERGVPLTTPCPRCTRPPQEPIPLQRPSSSRRPPQRRSPDARTALNPFKTPPKLHSPPNLRKREETDKRKRPAPAERWREPARPTTKRLNRDILVPGHRSMPPPKPSSKPVKRRSSRRRQAPVEGKRPVWERPRVWGPAAGVLMASLLWLVWPAAPVRYPPGVRAAGKPIQEQETRAPWTSGDFSIRSLARFDITGKVLSVHYYSTGRQGELSPMDLLVGWGLMSDQAVVDEVSFRQSERDYAWWADPSIRREDIVLQSANMHLIPAREEVAEALETIRVGEIIRLAGFLVEASDDTGWTWRSSTARSDTGAGSSELFWVESYAVVDQTNP